MLGSLAVLVCNNVSALVRCLFAPTSSGQYFEKIVLCYLTPTVPLTTAELLAAVSLPCTW